MPPTSLNAPLSPAPLPPRSRRPRKARFDVIQAFGELLVTCGLVVALFAFWQVFVTDWQVASATQMQIETLESDLGTYPDRISTDERHDAPPEATPVGPGEILGALHVPDWENMVIPLREGTTSAVLDLGAAGHYTETAQPGAIGNFSVAAHRRSYGSNFRRIDTLGEGDPVVVETPQAWLVYVYRSHEIVAPSEGDVVLPVPREPQTEPTERLMTMTTCHPEYGNSQRYIVHLVLDHWVPRESGLPKEIAH